MHDVKSFEFKITFKQATLTDVSLTENNYNFTWLKPNAKCSWSKWLKNRMIFLNVMAGSH